MKQWLLEDDYATMTTSKTKTKSLSNAQKLNQNQAEALSGAMDFELTDEATDDLLDEISAYEKFLKDRYQNI